MAHLLDNLGEEHHHLRQRLHPAQEPPLEVAHGQEAEDPTGRLRLLLGQFDGIQVCGGFINVLRLCESLV